MMKPHLSLEESPCAFKNWLTYLSEYDTSITDCLRVVWTLQMWWDEACSSIVMAIMNTASFHAKTHQGLNARRAFSGNLFVEHSQAWHLTLW